MIYWIIKNKEWLFSGIGITFIIAIIWIVQKGYARWKYKIFSGEFSQKTSNNKIQHERVGSKSIISYLPAFLLRIFLKPEKIIKQVHLELRSENPISINLSSEVPSIELFFNVTNISPLDFILDRLLIEMWFGQPTFHQSVLKRYYIPAREITKNIYFRYELASTQVNQIRKFIENDKRGSIHIYLTAYLESKVGVIEIQNNIERRNIS